MALIQSMDEQSAAWDAAAATGLFTLHAFVSLDGKHMLPCARVEWRIAPLPGTGGCGARVRTGTSGLVGAVMNRQVGKPAACCTKHVWAPPEPWVSKALQPDFDNAMQIEARVACWAERFAYVGLQGAVEAALLSMAVAGTAAFNAHCESVFMVGACLVMLCTQYDFAATSLLGSAEPDTAVKRRGRQHAGRVSCVHVQVKRHINSCCWLACKVPER